MNDQPKHDLQTVLDAINGDGIWAKENTITNSGGNKSVIAGRLGVSRQTIYNYIHRWASVHKAILDAKETEKDYVEGKIIQRIHADSDTMMIFYAKTQMKDRGYVERQEIEPIGEVNIKVVRK